MSARVSPAVETLERLLDAGMFARPPENRVHDATIASCVEHAVRGIVAFAKVKPEHLIDITACTSRTPRVMLTHAGPHPHYKFIIFNVASAYNREQLRGGSVFAPDGELGLRAVILETGSLFERPTAELSLVLPAWGTGLRAPGTGEIVIAKFDTDGFGSGDRYAPYARASMGSEKFTDADSYLKHLLGMCDLGNLVTADYWEGEIGRVMGFPGARSYLPLQLPLLGDYFNSSAEASSVSH